MAADNSSRRFWRFIAGDRSRFAVLHAGLPLSTLDYWLLSVGQLSLLCIVGRQHQRECRRDTFATRGLSCCFAF